MMRLDLNQKVKDCKKGELQALEWLYKTYAPKLLAVCSLYVKELPVAEDILQESFITIFSKIKQLKNNVAVEGWMKRIVVNNSLIYLKNRKDTFRVEEIEDQALVEEKEEEEKNIKERVMQLDITHAELLKIINSMPDGYRLVFNLYVFEGYSHNEIASQLGISPGTSRSQLTRARKTIQDKLFSLVEKNERKEKRKLAYWPLFITGLDNRLKYIDDLVKDKLNGYTVQPNTKLDIKSLLTRESKVQDSFKNKRLFVKFLNKNLVSLIGSISVVVLFVFGFRLITRNSNTPSTLIEQENKVNDSIKLIPELIDPNSGIKYNKEFDQITDSANKPDKIIGSTSKPINTKPERLIEKVEAETIDRLEESTDSVVNTDITTNSVIVKKTVVVTKKVIVEDTNN